MIRGGVASVAAGGQFAVGLAELARLARLDCEIEHRQLLAHRRVEQVGDRQAFPARYRPADHDETLLELLQRITRKRPILHLTGKSELGMAWLDQHAHERA